MTKLEAVKKIVARFQVAAKETWYEYDPAGSSTGYVPDPDDLEVLSALVGREVVEADLWFSAGYSGSKYVVTKPLVDAVSL